MTDARTRRYIRDGALLAAAVVLIIGVPVLSTHIRKERLSRQTLPALQGAVQEQIQSGEKTIIYLYDLFCIGCRYTSPLVDSLAQVHPHAVFTIDIDRQPDIAALFKAPGVPFTVLIENRKIKDVLLGYYSRNKIRKFFKE